MILTATVALNFAQPGPVLSLQHGYDGEMALVYDSDAQVRDSPLSQRSRSELHPQSQR